MYILIMFCNHLCKKKKKKKSCLENKLIIKLDGRLIKDWECIICLEDISSKLIHLCSPYDCDHIICYDCFVKKINYEKRNNLSRNIKDNIICSLCRSPLSKRWVYNNKVARYPLEINNNLFYFVECKS